MTTLLCIHGWPMTSATFSSLADELTDINVVAPDLPGFGGTSDSGFEHSLDAYADYVSAIAEEIPGGVHLVGLSMGCKIAMYIAARQPMWLQSLILIAPSYPDATIVSPDALAAQLGAFENVDTLTALVSGWASDTAPLVAWAQLASRDAYAWWLTDGRLADISNGVVNINVPTLVLHGENDPLRSSDALRKRIVDRLPNAELMVIAGASHCIQLDQPRITAGMLRDWMTHQGG
jgi:pimeloyl-ACP methyl ester carboxylesterase